MKRDETQVGAHFRFGANWSSYVKLINEDRIREAELGLERLVGRGTMTGRSFLDVGCGSGVHALAAGRLGSTTVLAMDIDPESTATTRALLEERGRGFPFNVVTGSILDARPESFGQFDIVYSWGVLHHTGKMLQAMRSASSLVKKQGLFVFALYRKTRFCGLWRVEKRWYKNAPRPLQRIARGAYAASMWVVFTATGRSFRNYLRDYQSSRGMDYWHDVHDWLGGYPYESIASEDVDTLMKDLGFVQVHRFVRERGAATVPGCDEFVYRRI